MSRREIIKWLAATTAAMAASGTLPLGNLAYAAPIDAPGYGSDPDILKFYKPGDVWPLTLSEAQRRTATALCDIILPADHLGPAASTLGVPQFVDEWVSAPYPIQALDRPVIIDGLAWLDAEAKKRFKNDFAALDAAQHKAICDDICNAATAKAEFEAAAHFFARFRAIAAGGYFSTPEGWTAIGYVGNAPLASFDGPPKAVLERLGVEQTVLWARVGRTSAFYRACGPMPPTTCARHQGGVALTLATRSPRRCRSHRSLWRSIALILNTKIGDRKR